MKKNQDSPVNPQSFWASQMGNKPQPAVANQASGNGFPQGPAFHHPLQDEEWEDGNGY
jgi:hypothetical protein